MSDLGFRDRWPSARNLRNPPRAAGIPPASFSSPETTAERIPADLGERISPEQREYPQRGFHAPKPPQNVFPLLWGPLLWARESAQSSGNTPSVVFKPRNHRITYSRCSGRFRRVPRASGLWGRRPQQREYLLRWFWALKTTLEVFPLLCFQ